MTKAHHHWQEEGIHVHYIYEDEKPVGCLALKDCNKYGEVGVGISLRSPSEEHYDKRGMRNRAINRCRHRDSFARAKKKDPAILRSVFNERYGHLKQPAVKFINMLYSPFCHHVSGRNEEMIRLSNAMNLSVLADIDGLTIKRLMLDRIIPGEHHV